MNSRSQGTRLCRSPVLPGSPKQETCLSAHLPTCTDRLVVINVRVSGSQVVFGDVNVLPISVLKSADVKCVPKVPHTFLFL